MKHERLFLAGLSNHDDTLVSRGERPMNDSRLLEYLQETLAALKSGRSHHAKRALEALIKEMRETQQEAA
jgi:hypothetical protein